MYRQYPDSNGDTITLYDDDGMIRIRQIDNQQQISDLKTRDGDILVCSYQRSGTHWTFEIIHMLVTGVTEPTSLATKQSHFFTRYIEGVDELPSPRVLPTHQRFHDLPSDFILKRRKMVVVLRDPKDVCVSTYKLIRKLSHAKYTGKFDGFISLFLQGKAMSNGWSNWVLSFEKGLKEHPELTYHVLHYEKLKQDPVTEIRRLAEYLEVDSSVAERVAEQTNISVMKEAQLKTTDLAQRVGTEIVFGKGESGGWRDWFTEEQAKNFDKTICEQLGRDTMTTLLE